MASFFQSFTNAEMKEKWEKRPVGGALRERVKGREREMVERLRSTDRDGEVQNKRDGERERERENKAPIFLPRGWGQRQKLEPRGAGGRRKKKKKVGEQERAV